MYHGLSIVLVIFNPEKLKLIIKIDIEFSLAKHYSMTKMI